MSHHGIITELREWLSTQIIGQERLIDRLLIALLADGHLLVEGAPGLAKTKAIKDLSKAVEGDFHRIQFTPDLVMATQNPIEQEGTYPLPEAQLDRFLMHVAIGYPDASAERDILKLVRSEAANVATEVPKEIPQDSLFEARQEILAMHMAPEVEEYIIQLIMATREPAQYGEDLAGWLEYGASPRGTISLDRCARAHAWIQGRDFVSPDDVQDVLFDVLRHRILLSFEAEASGITPDQVLETIRQRVPSA